jgi:hypothetical protein
VTVVATDAKYGSLHQVTRDRRTIAFRCRPASTSSSRVIAFSDSYSLSIYWLSKKARRSL